MVELGQINALHHHTDLARSFYNEALGMYRRMHDAAGIAHTYDQLALLDGNPQNFSQALKYDRDSSGLAETYENISCSFEEKGEYEKTLSHFLRVLGAIRAPARGQQSNSGQSNSGQDSQNQDENSGQTSRK